MRTIRRQHLARNAYRVVVAVGADESLPFSAGDQAGLDDTGTVSIDVVRRGEAPEPGLERGERTYVLEARTLETVGTLPDIGQ